MKDTDPVSKWIVRLIVGTLFVASVSWAATWVGAVDKAVKTDVPVIQRDVAEVHKDLNDVNGKLDMLLSERGLRYVPPPAKE